MDYFICRTFSLVLCLLFSLTMDFVMSKIFFMRCRTFSLSHFPMSNKFCGSYNGVENYLSNIIHWQTCQTLLSICRKHSVALYKSCRTFSIEHFDVENLPWSMGKCIVEHFSVENCAKLAFIKKGGISGRKVSFQREKKHSKNF